MHKKQIIAKKMLATQEHCNALVNILIKQNITMPAKKFY